MLWPAVQKTIREAREKQLSVTDLLAKLTNATHQPSMAEVAARNAGSLTEEFFLTTSTYMEMVRCRAKADDGRV